MNGDGIADLAAADLLAVANSGSNTVSLLIGTGDGEFAGGTPLPLARTPLPS